MKTKTIFFFLILSFILGSTLSSLGNAVAGVNIYQHQATWPRINDPLGIGTTASGNIVYVTYRSNVQKYNSSGRLLDTLGVSGTADRDYAPSGIYCFSSPGGVAIDLRNNIYVADSANCRIQKFNLSGRRTHVWGSFSSSRTPRANEFYLLKDVAVGPDGKIYTIGLVNGFRDARIQRFNSDGSRATIITDTRGLFNAPSGIAVAPSGIIYVADTDNNRILKFNADGSRRGAFGSRGTRNRQFKNPRGLTIDSAGNVYVADTGNHRILKFTSERAGNTFICKVGKVDASGNPVAGRGLGEFDEPKDVAVSADGLVMYVADKNNDRVLKLVLVYIAPVSEGTPTQELQTGTLSDLPTREGGQRESLPRTPRPRFRYKR